MKAYSLTYNESLAGLKLNAESIKIVNKGKKIWETLMKETATNNDEMFANALQADLDALKERMARQAEKASKPNGKGTSKPASKPANENKPIENAAE